jgi:hypothetical protein
VRSATDRYLITGRVFEVAVFRVAGATAQPPMARTSSGSSASRVEAQASTSRVSTVLARGVADIGRSDDSSSSFRPIPTFLFIVAS